MYHSVGNSELCRQNLIIGEKLVKFYNKQDFLVAYNAGESCIYIGLCLSKFFCGCHLCSIFCMFSSHMGVTRRIRASWKIVLKTTFIALRTISMGNPSYSNWRCNLLCGSIAIESRATCEVWQFSLVSCLRTVLEWSKYALRDERKTTKKTPINL